MFDRTPCTSFRKKFILENQTLKVEILSGRGKLKNERLGKQYAAEDWGELVHAFKYRFLWLEQPSVQHVGY